MEEIIKNISESINTISQNIKPPMFYNSAWFAAIIGVLGGVGGVVIGIIFDRKLRSIDMKDEDKRLKLLLAENSVRFQFSQILPKLQGLKREVDLYDSGPAPSIEGKTAWQSVKANLIQKRVNQEDDFIKKMDNLLDLQRHLSNQAGWPNAYSESIKDLLKELIEDCEEITKMSAEEIIERFEI